MKEVGFDKYWGRRSARTGPIPQKLFVSQPKRGALSIVCTSTQGSPRTTTRMTNPKAALPQGMNTEPDTSTLGTQLSSLSVTDDNIVPTSSSSSPDREYQVFI